MWSAQAHIRKQAELYPETRAETLAIGSGVAVFSGLKSPLNGLYGLGLWEPATPAHLDEAQTFFSERGVKFEAEVCPFADPSFAQLLAGRGFIIQDYMNTYARETKRVRAEVELPRGASIRTATAVEAKQWFEISESSGNWAEPDGASFMTVRTTQKAGTQLFIAWLDGEPVSAGALEMHESVAALMAGYTQPGYRGRGLQTALLQVRISAAKAASCDLVLVHSRPGTISQRNILRAGFQMVYTNIDLRKEKT